MKAIIISIGDEILIGQVVNSNAAFIAEKLNAIGIEVGKILTVGDNEIDILAAFRDHYHKADVTLVTGGLGPTHDDITRTAVSEFFNTKLVKSKDARRYVEEFLQKRNRPWNDAAENQTLVPEGAKVIPNKYGTAAGEFFEHDNKYFIVMPGVPYEMESMMEDFVVPFFLQKKLDRYIVQRTLMTTGIPESELAIKLGKIEDFIQDAKLAFLPSPTGVRLRISVIGTDKIQCDENIRKIELHIRDRANKFIYGLNDVSLEEVLGKLLLERNLKIAIAESCTGGMIAHKITNVSSSSQYLERAVVAYSNQSKIDLLHVPKETIEKSGAVSKETAMAMALGIRQIAGVDIGLSTTGIAGPTGGSREKPIGLVWIGYSDKSGTFAYKFNFGDGRTRVKERASQAAMDIVRRKILKIE
jgi:nicotinamide-nucleotide amidase